MRFFLALILLAAVVTPAQATIRVLGILNRTSYLISYVEAYASDSDLAQNVIHQKREIYEGEQQIFVLDDIYDRCAYVIVLHMRDKAVYHVPINLCRTHLMSVTEEVLRQEHQRQYEHHGFGIAGGADDRPRTQKPR